MNITKDSEQQVVFDNFYTEKLTKEIVNDLLSKLLTGDYSKDEIEEMFPKELVSEIVKCFISTFKGKQNGCKLMVSGKTKLVIVGDIHGDMITLKRILEKRYCQNNMYVFLGDYVDKRLRGVEVMLTLMLMRIRSPTTFIMLRGNHEDAFINKQHDIFGFHSDCVSYYGSNGNFVFDSITSCYDYLPIVCTINNLYFTHGGIPVDLDKLDQILNGNVPIDCFYDDVVFQTLWSDPDILYEGSDYMNTDYKDNFRGGSSKLFGKKAVDRFLNKTKYKCIIRGHQFNKDEPVFTTPDNKVITVFSTTNYNGSKNDAAVLLVDLSKASTRFDIEYIKYVENIMDENNYLFSNDSDNDDDYDDYDDDVDDDDNDDVKNSQKYHETVIERKLKRLEKKKRELMLQKEREMERDLLRSEMVININNNFVTIDESRIDDSHFLDDIDFADLFPMQKTTIICKFMDNTKDKNNVDIKKDNDELKITEIKSSSTIKSNGEKGKLFDFS